MTKWDGRAALAATVLFGLGLIAGSLPNHALAHGDEEHGAGAETFAAGEPGDAKSPSRTVEVTMSEGNGTMTYTPAEVNVKKGEQIKLVVKNIGTLKHEFFLDSVEHNAHHKIEMQKNPEMEHDDPNAQSVEPGKQVEVLWKFSKAGIFEFACLIPGHYEAGMHGKIVVK